MEYDTLISTIIAEEIILAILISIIFFLNDKVFIPCLVLYLLWLLALGYIASKTRGGEKVAKWNGKHVGKKYPPWSRYAGGRDNSKDC